MKFTARVKTDEGEWVDMPIRAIFLDEHGRAERVSGQTGLQYSEFELREVKPGWHDVSEFYLDDEGEGE